jgi:hypothetical protein
VKSRKFSVASFISAILAVCTLILWLLTFSLNPWDHKVSLGKIHVGVWEGFSGDTLGRLVIFNDAKYGPYRGSIVSLANEKYPSKPVWVWRIGENYGIGKENDFDGKGEIELTEIAADFPGIYYRHFQRPNEPQPLWTLMMSLWYPLFLFSILPVIWIICRWRSRRSKISSLA